MRTRLSSVIRPTVFVKIWQTSNSRSQAARRLSLKMGREITEEVARLQAVAFRAAGVELKDM
jgi:hypothetical protein